MKVLALLLIAGALSLFGSAFSGIWTPPGLENVPTYKAVLKHTPWGVEEEEAEPKSEIIALSGAHQFRPHGVESDWGVVSVIDLPRKPQKELEAQSVDTPSTPQASAPPTRRATASTNYSPRSQTVASRSSSSSYRGSRGSKMTSSYTSSTSRSGTASAPRRSVRPSQSRTRTSARSNQARATASRARSIARRSARVHRR